MISIESKKKLLYFTIFILAFLVFINWGSDNAVDVYILNEPEVVKKQDVRVEQYFRDILEQNIIDGENYSLFLVRRRFTKERSLSNKIKSGTSTYIVKIDDQRLEFYLKWEEIEGSVPFKITEIYEVIDGKDTLIYRN